MVQEDHDKLVDWIVRMHPVCGLFIRPDASGCEQALNGLVACGSSGWLRVFFFDDKGAASVLTIERKRVRASSVLLP